MRRLHAASGSKSRNSVLTLWVCFKDLGGGGALGFLWGTFKVSVRGLGSLCISGLGVEV